MTRSAPTPEPLDHPVDVRFEMDSPSPEAILQGDVLHVRGWALIDGVAPSVVEVLADGSARTRARIRLPRPDVAREFPGCDEAAVSGFEARIPLDLPPGQSRNISFRVRLRSHQVGAWTSSTHQVVLDSPPADKHETELSNQLGDQTRKALRGICGPAQDPHHVLIFTHSLELGGGQLWLQQLLDGLVRQHGWHATVVTQLDGPLRADCVELGIPVHLTSQYRVNDVAAYEGHVAELAHLARSSGAAVGLVNTLGAFPAADAVQRAGLPCAWVIHESFRLAEFSYHNWGAAGLRPGIREKWESALRSADRLLFVADATREMFVPLSAPQRCQTIRYGTPLATVGGRTGQAERAHARSRLGLDDETTLILNVGVLEPRKGQGPLISAMHRVRERHPRTLLHIVGNHPSSYGHALSEYTQSSRLADWVDLIPIQRDPRPWFEAADLFVNSSDVESLPRSILEAVCCGLPVLASDVFGAREMITDGHSGWLCEPNDVDALAVGLLRALETPVAKRRQMAAAAFDDLADWINPGHYAAEYATILDQLVKG